MNMFIPKLIGIRKTRLGNSLYTKKFLKKGVCVAAEKGYAITSFPIHGSVTVGENLYLHYNGIP